MLAVVEKLDGRLDPKWRTDAVYIQARYDAALSHVGTEALLKTRIIAHASGLAPDRGSAEASALEYTRRVANAWRDEIPGATTRKEGE